MLSWSAEDLRQKKGCHACRSSKVKCDEKQPSCSACAKRGRKCSRPLPELRLSVQRRGFGPVKSREPTWSPPRIRQADEHLVDGSTPSTEVHDWWSDIGMDNEYPASSISADYGVETLPPMTPYFGLEGFEPFIPFPDVDSLWHPGFGSLLQPALSDNHIPASNSMILNPNDVHALDHYQTAFSIYRTTKVPRWSTHRLLLDLASENTTIMHFILAVSINDVCYRQGNDPPREAQAHFKAAVRNLVEMIQEDTVKNYKFIMAGFLFLYLYIPKQRSMPLHTISQLSMTVRDFIKSHKLDSLCLEQISEAESEVTSSDRNVLARLIIWTYDEDVKCGFQGSGAHLAEYLTAYRERTMAVYEVSRVVLQAHWGKIYPKDQADDDDDNAMQLEFLWVLTALWQDINELTQKTFSAYVESCLRIEQRFSLLQKKYSSIFQSSAVTDMPRTRVLMNADYDVVLFNALKIYYFRTTAAEVEMEAPADIQTALKNLLNIIRRTFASNGNELHDRLQWPLFLAGIETDDGFYSDWILSRISTNRARAALETIIRSQTYFEKRIKRLSIQKIRSLLFEGLTIETFALPQAEQHSFWDTLAEF